MAKICRIGIQKRVPLSPAVVKVLIVPVSLKVDPTPLTANMPFGTAGVEAVRPPKSAETVCAFAVKTPASIVTTRRKQPEQETTCREISVGRNERYLRQPRSTLGEAFKGVVLLCPRHGCIPLLERA